MNLVKKKKKFKPLKKFRTPPQNTWGNKISMGKPSCEKGFLDGLKINLEKNNFFFKQFFFNEKKRKGFFLLKKKFYFKNSGEKKSYVKKKNFSLKIPLEKSQPKKKIFTPPQGKKPPLKK